MSHEKAFQDGLVAAKAGKKMVARIQFEQVAEIAPDYVHGWIWLAWTADSPQQAEEYLSKALKLEPQNRLISTYLDVVTALGVYDADEDCSALLGKPEEFAEAEAEPIACAEEDEGVSLDTVQATSEQEQEPETHSESGCDTQVLCEEASDREELSGGVAEEIVEEPTPALEEISSDEESGPAEVDCDETADFQDVQELMAAAKKAASVESSDQEHATLPDSEAASSEIGQPGFERPDETSEPLVEPVADEAVQPEDSLVAEVEELEEEVKSSIAERASDSETNADDSLAAEADTVARHPEPVESEKEPSEQNEEAPAPTVLVVDDSPTVRKLVTITLKSGGYQVKTAEDGVDAMKMLVNFTPDLILLDVNMPRMDGYKLCKLIKRHEKTKFIPVVMLSGKDGMFDKLRGTLVGCNDYISKPFESADLLKQVDQYIAVGIES